MTRSPKDFMIIYSCLAVTLFFIAFVLYLINIHLWSLVTSFGIGLVPVDLIMLYLWLLERKEEKPKK